jgi:hypothetical protein
LATRACLKSHPDPAATADRCRLCWLAVNVRDYQRSWGLPETGQFATTAESRGVYSPPPKFALPCVHRGDPTGETRQCPSCSGTVAVPLFGCGLHGVCTERKAVKADDGGGDLACCGHCPDRRQSLPAAPVHTRHLLYFVYPRRGSRWRLRLQRLRERLPLFNGRRLVAVATDDTTEATAATVAAALGGDCDVGEVANDPGLREVAAFETLFGRLSDHSGDGEATLFGHAKGVTQPPERPCHRWGDVMEEVCLDYWPLVAETLTTAPVAGCFKKVGRGWKASESKSLWHYSGSWFWFRNRDLYSRPWQAVERFWCGIETYPSVLFGVDEAASLFHTGAVPRLNLYNPDYWRRTVEPAYAEFRERNADRRTATTTSTAAVRLDSAV